MYVPTRNNNVTMFQKVPDKSLFCSRGTVFPEELFSKIVPLPETGQATENSITGKSKGLIFEV